MIQAATITPSDTIVEIGPGKGALTRLLLETGARVIAFELDERMIDYLHDELSEYIQRGQLKLIHQDVLDSDMAFFADIYPYKLVANIPYYITNAIIRKFLETEYHPQDMVLLVQKEVAERIVCRDGKESLLSLSVSAFGNARYVAKVDRKYFSPSPKVHSAIIHVADISLNKIGNIERREMFFKLIHSAFTHKRKKTIRNLESLAHSSLWKEIFNALSLDENIRAEDISFPLWLKILDLFLKIGNIKSKDN